ncbi:MAG: hypothetical protein LBO08_00855 [Rickettsiales bacterium]|jgi:hypothetical protein|nr:hypothetical protein [Rickettsiales bacterium]
MKKILFIIHYSLFIAFAAFAANADDRATAQPYDETRVGVRANAAARMPSVSGINLTAGVNLSAPDEGGGIIRSSPVPKSKPDDKPGDKKPDDKPAEPVIDEAACRENYRSCMDDFCLLGEGEGGRCACSANINASQSKIKEISDIQAKAEKAFGAGVEYEKLGAKAMLVFGASGAAKSKRIDWAAWMNGQLGTSGGLDSDEMLGDDLYAAAVENCATKLKACGPIAGMEEILYGRMVTADCKSFDSLLKNQKKIAEDNLAIAEKAVRTARLEMLDNTNKYNRGECLLAYRSCIADKGGCGANFENCLDEDLLGRRANACGDVLDQCMAVKTYVLKDWQDESEMILKEAAKYADKNMRSTCLAKTQLCLEDSCQKSTDSLCLDNVSTAAGICPIIDECNGKISGFKSGINDKLGFLRVKFCENDIDKCLQDKCGANYDKPECVGRKTSEIVAMCPQNMFPSCKGQEQFDVIVSAALLQMDYQMMRGCINYFSEQLGRACGTDMSCLPEDDAILNMASSTQKIDWRANADKTVNEFFKQFEKDQTIAACNDAKKPAGRSSLGASVFNTAKLIAQINAESRAFRQYVSKRAELSRREDTDSARKTCEAMKAEDPCKDGKCDKDGGLRVVSVVFEPSLRNCHICRAQKVCEVGGESKAASAAKMAAGAGVAGASIGTQVSPGWGTAIGGAVGIVGGIIGGMSTGGEKEFCQDVESCEDVNM